MHNTTSIQLNDEEDKEGTKQPVVSLEEIARPEVASVILQKGCPGLSIRLRWTRSTGLAHVFGDGALTEQRAQLAKFILNPFGTPQSIVERHDESGPRCPEECAT